MKFSFLSLLCLALTCVAACSETPTSPTSSPAGLPIDVSAQEPPPVPPRGNPAAATPFVAVTSFVAFGDSITWGTESRFDGLLFDAGPSAYPEQLRQMLATYHPGQGTFSVINEGIPGEGAVEGSRRIASVLASRRPQVLLLLEGVNDLNVGRSVGTITSALETILDYARLYNVPVIMATMFQTYEADDPQFGHRTNSADQIQALNAGIRQLAAGRQNVYLVDLYRSFGNNRNYLGNDGLHPTPLGYQRMAATFVDAIEEFFPVRVSVQ